MKSNSIINNIKLTLLAVTGTMLLSAVAIGAESPKQDTTAAKEVAEANPTGHDSKEIEVIPGPTAEKAPKGLPYFARVGNMTISWQEYNLEFSSQSTKKFYHGKPSEADLAAFERKVGDNLITNAMLVQEAKRRNLKPDAAFIKQQIDNEERRFAKDPNWPQARPRVLPIITERAKNESLRKQVEPLVRKVPAPSAKQLRKYYADHPDKFTSPPQERVSIILLRMDPGAPNADWQQALVQGNDLVKRLRAGDDFAQMARDYSGDVTAEAGGDMGYLHQGMLPGLPSQVVTNLQPGDTSDPVTLMEGVAIFRLTDRKPGKLNSFKSVEKRVRELWRTEQSDKAWESFMAKLKKDTPVQVDESFFTALPNTSEKAAESPKTTNP